ncbi:MAG TPA: hypothetical protein VGG40_00960 [Solirubrobacterales bacterium]
MDPAGALDGFVGGAGGGSVGAFERGPGPESPGVEPLTSPRQTSVANPKVTQAASARTARA